MRDSAAKTIFVITLQGDRGPFSRADLVEALRAGEVQREDQARSAFGRPLGTVAQVLSAPVSDRSPVSRAITPPARPQVQPDAHSRPWLVPLLIALVVALLIALLMAARPAADSPPLPSAPSPAAPVVPGTPVEHPAEPTPAPTDQSLAPPAVSNGDVLPGLAEAKSFRLVCDLDLRRLGKEITYRTDNRTRIGTFDRIAYLVELSTKGGPNRYIWTAMDAFTSDARIGLPTIASKSFFQTAVTNLQVRCNLPGVTSGDFASGGNIEFWPCDYGPTRSDAIPTASSESYDFSDTPKLGKDGAVIVGYGCMQVHNAALKQTLFAINHWSEGKKADIGIGNAPGQHPDWTMAANAEIYSGARLRVLIRPR